MAMRLPASPRLADDLGEEVDRLVAVLVGGDVGDEGVGDEVEIFELADDEHRVALGGEHQRLKGVVAGRLLPGQVEDVLRAR